jgi:hypothetical protein
MVSALEYPCFRFLVARLVFLLPRVTPAVEIVLSHLVWALLVSAYPALM